MSPKRRRILYTLTGAGILGIGGYSVFQTQDLDSTVSDPSADSPRSPTPSQSRQPTGLVAADGEPKASFGDAVDLSTDGQTVLVGASTDDNPHGLGSGSAYVFELTADGWEQVAKLNAPEGDPIEDLGNTVALSADGRKAIVGSKRRNTKHGENTGSAHIFEFADGQWHHELEFVGEGEPGETVGWSVAMAADGQTALIGAPQNNSSGSVYVLGNASGTWNTQSRLAPDDEKVVTSFGYTVDLSHEAEVAIVSGHTGDVGFEPPPAEFAYIFQRVGDGWEQQATMMVDGDTLGSPTVCISGNGTVAFVSADPGHLDGPVGVHVYEESGTEWTRRTVLRPDEVGVHDKFGTAMATTVDGRLVFVGTREDDQNGEKAGAVYVFRDIDGSWRLWGTIAESDEADWFGADLATTPDGSTLLVGAAIDDEPNGVAAGSAYVFEDGRIHSWKAE